MTNHKDKPLIPEGKDTAARPTIEFRVQVSDKTQSIVLYVDGAYDGTVFTIMQDEQRDVIARRLTIAFRDVLMLGVELGVQTTPAVDTDESTSAIKGAA